MRMHHGLSAIERDITNHPNHFVLTFDGKLLIDFALGIETPQRCSTHCSDGGEMSTSNLILFGKLYQPEKASSPW
jgi:hypothetical protein